MADKTTTAPAATTAEAEKPNARRVEKVDLTKPFFITFDQTDARNNFKIFTGDNAKADAMEHATTVATDSERMCAVIGPQSAVKAPPKEPVADDVKLDFI